MVRGWVCKFSLAGADLAHSEGGLSLLRWLLGGYRLGMGIFFSWAYLDHSGVESHIRD